jgi:hypothetical protein
MLLKYLALHLFTVCIRSIKLFTVKPITITSSFDVIRVSGLNINRSTIDKILISMKKDLSFLGSRISVFVRVSFIGKSIFNVTSFFSLLISYVQASAAMARIITRSNNKTRNNVFLSISLG